MKSYWRNRHFEMPMYDFEIIWSKEEINDIVVFVRLEL